MTTREVDLEVDAGIATVRLNAPERRNALTAEMAVALRSTIEAVGQRPDVACVVVTGTGASFCAGADRELLRRAGLPDDHEAREGLESVYESFVALGRCAVPTIAAVQGHAVGAGLNLALAADVRVVADDALLLSGFGRIGIHPGGGHLYLLEQLVGREAAAAMAFFDQPVTGSLAVNLGLAWKAVAQPSDTVPEAYALAERLRSQPALARLMARTLRRGVVNGSWMTAIEQERGAQLVSLMTRNAVGASPSV